MRRTRLFDSRFEREEVRLDLQRKYVENDEFVSEINAVQDLWQATHYPWMSGMTLGELLKRAGGLPVTPSSHPSPHPSQSKSGLQQSGSAGGCPYLIAGKYAQDFGAVEESYKGEVTSCTESKDSTRYYATDYYYVGGYYGACNEPEMRLERQ